MNTIIKEFRDKNDFSWITIELEKIEPGERMGYAVYRNNKKGVHARICAPRREYESALSVVNSQMVLRERIGKALASAIEEALKHPEKLKELRNK